MLKKLHTPTVLVTVLFFGLFISISSGYLLYNIEGRKITREFHKEIDENVASLHKEIVVNFEALRSLAILFSDSNPPDWNHFSLEAKSILSRHNGIQALEWIPLVMHAQRGTYESKPLLNLPKFEIIARKKQGNMVRSPIKEEYFPVYFVEPYIGNELAYGFDLASNTTRYQTLISARNSGLPTATGSITLVQERGNQKGFLAFIPIYKVRGLSTEERRKKNLLGFVLGVFKIGDIYHNSIKHKVIKNIQITLLDETQPLDKKTLYKTPNQGVELNNEIIYKKSLPLLWGRQWSIAASPSKAFITNRRNVLPLAVFISFLVFTMYIALYINFISKRATAVQKVVLAQNQEINEANKKLKLLSRSDGLTGIANRRYMDEFFEHEWRLALRNQTSISFIIIDIDFFKLYNDNYGHPQGDDCLKRVAKQLQSNLHRPRDLVARYGGEEFSLILPQTTSPIEIAENCRASIEKMNIPHEFSKNAQVITVSIGICAVIPKINTSSRLLIETADKALYLAKENGRNKVEELSIGARIPSP
ncbi:diguanylate cyclase domain-containing protein [Colwellia piezophila]|uniref:diguanylate cyclase domain-containing protein n=1 Tax=Colwellia piezophila TaxID=211668 RepID=UPI00036F25A4|nr:diguanylate cyclase [Colwellia piezophila]